MHKIGKKGLFAFAVSLMLALLVSAAVLSVSAPSARRAVFADEQAQGNVAEVNGTQYATVKEAFENAPENGVVTLIADATHTATTAKGEDGNTHLSNSITVTKSLTFDLNGHTFAVSLPGEVYSAIYVEGGITFTLKDSAGNGKLTSENGYGVSASEGGDARSGKRYDRFPDLRAFEQQYDGHRKLYGKGRYAERGARSCYLYARAG